MGVEQRPEIKMARRVIQKHSITIPFNLDNIVEEYANILYKSISLEGVDGVCLNLKTPGKTPTVIVNSNSSKARQKFTLAHELGHIIIPWHNGTIIDNIDEEKIHLNTFYWEIEREANRFASELLMPFDWVFSLYKQNYDFNNLKHKICMHCGVSEIAASIRIQRAVSEIDEILIPAELVLQLYMDLDNLALVQNKIITETKLNPARVAAQMVKYLPGRVAYCIEIDEVVIGCGKTTDTHSFYQLEGEKFIRTPYPFFQDYIVSTWQHINTHWWVLGSSFDIPHDNRSWREILEKIANEISPPQGIESFKKSVNGKLSGAHGSWRRKNPNLGVNEFIEDSIQRFNNPDFIEFIQHTEFPIFIQKRCADFFVN